MPMMQMRATMQPLLLLVSLMLMLMMTERGSADELPTCQPVRLQPCICHREKLLNLTQSGC